MNFRLKNISVNISEKMNKPEMFYLTKHLSQHDSRQTLEDYADSFKWRVGGGDSILDAGCKSITFKFSL